MSEIDTTSLDVDTDERQTTCGHVRLHGTVCGVTIDMDNDDWVLGSNEIAYCEDHLFMCASCNDITPDVEQHEYYSGYCDPCGDRMFTCERCNDTEHENDMYRVSGDRWCYSCWDEYSRHCDRCDNDYSIYNGACCTGGHSVEDYSYKPYPQFHWVENDPDADRHVFMGFELEVESNGSEYGGPEHVYSVLGDLAYFKEDGSLDDGFEIVTHPMTLAYAHEMRWDWTQGLLDMGYRSWDRSSCGLHVHVDRRAFTGRLHQYSFTLLLMRNKALSYLVAGRQGSSYASFDKDVRAEIPKYMKGQYNNAQRYSAVNVLPTATLEVRMFRGSLKKERILAALEYVHSAVEYSRGARSGVGAEEYLTAPAFIQWLRVRKDLYPNLLSYINQSVEFGFSEKSYTSQNNGE
jgi:hypothetical protein